MADLAVTIAVVVALSSQHPLPPLEARQVHCLAEVAFYEARGEGEIGQRMVIDVVLNRVARPGYPKTICAVVGQPGQFTYRRQPTLLRTNSGRESWRIAVTLASLRLSGHMPSLTQATHFYHKGSRPRWVSRNTRVAVFGDHIFVEMPH